MAIIAKNVTKTGNIVTISFSFTEGEPSERAVNAHKMIGKTYLVRCASTYWSGFGGGYVTIELHEVQGVKTKNEAPCQCNRSSETTSDEHASDEPMNDEQKIAKWAGYPEGYSAAFWKDVLEDIDIWFGCEGGNIVGDVQVPSLHKLIEERGLSKKFARELALQARIADPKLGLTDSWEEAVFATPKQRIRALAKVIEGEEHGQ